MALPIIICITKDEYIRLNSPSRLNYNYRKYDFVYVNDDGQYCYKLVPIPLSREGGGLLGGGVFGGGVQGGGGAPGGGGGAPSVCCLEPDQANECLQADQNGNLEPDQGCK